MKRTNSTTRTMLGVFLTSFAFAVLFTACNHEVIPPNPTPPVEGTVATKPLSLSGLPDNTKVKLGWNESSSNGGSTITDYIIEYKLTSATTWSVFPDGVSAELTTTVTGLTNGSGYDFRVSAVNSKGTSPASDVASATPKAPVVPTRLDTLTANFGFVLDSVTRKQDGKDPYNFTNAADKTDTLKFSSNGTYQRIHQNGTVFGNGSFTLSADGKQLTIGTGGAIPHTIVTLVKDATTTTMVLTQASTCSKCGSDGNDVPETLTFYYKAKNK